MRDRIDVSLLTADQRVVYERRVEAWRHNDIAVLPEADQDLINQDARISWAVWAAVSTIVIMVTMLDGSASTSRVVMESMIVGVAALVVTFVNNTRRHSALGRYVDTFLDDIGYENIGDKLANLEDNLLKLVGGEGEAPAVEVHDDESAIAVVRFARINPDGELYTAEELRGPEEFEARDTTDGDALAEMAGHDSRRIRRLVAHNKHTHPSILLAMAADEDWVVRQVLAHRDDEQVLTVLAADDVDGVRLTVARNPSTPAESMIRLAGDEWGPIRQAIATSPIAPPEAFDKLLGDDYAAIVAGKIVSNGRLVLENPACPAQTLAGALTRGDADDRFLIAAHPNADAGTLTALASSDDEVVRTVTASNRSCPADVLAVLSHDASESVRAAVADNPTAPADTLVELLTTHPELRPIIASNESTPGHTLASLVDIGDDVVLATLAENLSTPEDALTIIATAHPHLAPAVADNLAARAARRAEEEARIADVAAMASGDDTESIDDQKSDEDPDAPEVPGGEDRDADHDDTTHDTADQLELDLWDDTSKVR